MSGYELPTSAIVNGIEYEIRSDYRAILDILQVFADPTITDEDRTIIVMTIFYPDFISMPIDDIERGIEYMQWFVNGGQDQQHGGKKPKLMDWEQDFPLLVSPINRVLNCEIRAVDYLHWWTFLAAYREIGDCLFAQVVSIRKKRMQGKKLDKMDQQFYRENHDLVDLRTVETDEDKAIFDEWMG